MRESEIGVTGTGSAGPAIGDDRASPVAGPIVFLGDSITEQWSRYRPHFFADHGFVNRGIGGQTTRDIRARFSEDVDRAGAAAIHLLAGTNDIAENGGPVPLSSTEENLAWMIAQAGALGRPILVGSVPPAAVFAWNPRVRPADTIVELNAWLARYAEAQGAAYIDYHAALRSPANGLRAGLGPDGAHLDAKGYRVIEPILLGAVARVLGPRTPKAPSWVERMRRLAPMRF